jgi:hypothetical protein
LYNGDTNESTEYNDLSCLYSNLLIGSVTPVTMQIAQMGKKIKKGGGLYDL